jgi:predicted ATP-binding protein involved in virulence
MQIRELHIQNFRRFSDLKISFEKDLTVLVARNGQGKSSILDAITILLGTYVGAFDLGNSAGIKARDARRIMNLDTMEPEHFWPVRIEGKVAIPKSEKEILTEKVKTYSIARELKGPKLRTTTAEAAAITDYGKTLQAEIYENSNVALPVVAYYGTGRLWKAHKNMQRQRVLTENRSLGYEDCLSPSSNFVQVQQWMAKATYAKVQSSEMKSRPSSLILTARLRAIQKAVDFVLREEGWSDFRYDFDYEELSMSHNQHGPLPVSQMSDGVRSVVSLVADLAFRCMRLNGSHGEDSVQKTRGIVMIDELDQHLHPGWQQRILPALREAFPKVQFIVTTHSPEVLSTAESRQIQILEEGRCYAAPPGSLGAESQRLLQTVLGLKSLRPPVNEVAELNEYLELVYTGRWKDPRAVALRGKLDQLYQGEEPALLEADLQIENQEWEAEAAP